MVIKLHSMMKKTSEDSLHVKKTFFPKFKLLNSGCGLSAGVYGNFIQRNFFIVVYRTRFRYALIS